jgi:hypothetical protein
MKKTTMKRSTKVKNHRHQNPCRKKRRQLKKKRSSQHAKPSPKLTKMVVDNSSSKLSEPGNNLASPPVNERHEAVTDPSPKPTSPQAQLLEQGKKWKQLCDEGASLNDLAEKFGGSKTRARDLVSLAGLPEDLKQGYLEGKLGRKKVLALARARNKATQASEVVSSQEDLPKKSQPSPLPVITAEQRQKKLEEYTKLIMDWFHSLDLAPGFWADVFSQVNSALYGAFPWLFADEAPRPNENWAETDPQKVIKLCKPVGQEDPMPEVLNNLVRWLARWTQRVIPDRKMMRESLAMAEATLLREAWEKCCW